jgi:hypothetical protein
MAAMKRRNGGKAALSEASARRPTASVRGSSAIVAERFSDSTASALAVVEKSVIRLLSASGSRSSASATAPAPSM